MAKSVRVLLADDDDAFVELVSRITKGDKASERCEIFRVKDGNEAVSYILREGEFADADSFPIPDAIILDQRMNTMDGDEALVEIRKDQRTTEIPICMLSTSADEKLRSLCYKSGATFCIQKPIDYDKLKSRIRLLLAFFVEVLELDRLDAKSTYRPELA